MITEEQPILNFEVAGSQAVSLFVLIQYNGHILQVRGQFPRIKLRTIQVSYMLIIFKIELLNKCSIYWNLDLENIQ